ncbi:MAG TPA: SusC/RagA family TonB-linked outer membrane protein [Gemmatimonadales bacterium]|nr:SusC/RagA family TonB-linked outer membrane protein [Gemmatimonadales bacterium]
MRVPRFGPPLAFAVAAAMLSFPTAPLSAQAVIKGKVTSDAGDPLGGANVLVANTNLGAITAVNGTYTLTIAAEAAHGQQIVLTARYIGHKPMSRTVTLSSGEQTQDFSLANDPLRLEEVVVTGVAEATDRRKLPMTVASVSQEQLQAVPGQTALQAVEGKVAAVRLVPNSAQPGGEPSLRLRGATSIGGRQDPLIIVDGVITRFGLADIAGEDIERVEIVKGAAASALYGSDAANGVVQIFTKRGQSLPDGSLRVSTRIEGGANQMPTRLQFAHHHAWEIEQTPGYCKTLNPTNTVSSPGNYCLTSGGARIIRADQIAKNPFSTYYDFWDDIVTTGQFWTGYASLGQRTGNTNFNASFEETRNKGVIFGLGGYNRQNFRLNVDQQLHSNFDASLSAFYGKSTNGRAAEGETGPFFGMMFLQPDVNIKACCNPDGSPYVAQIPLGGDVANKSNPLYELANRKIDQDRNRFTGSGRLRWRIKPWLQAEGTFGYDQESQEYTDLTPFGFLTPSGTPLAGSLFDKSTNNWQANGGVTLTSVRHFGIITNTTKVAAIFEDQRSRFLQANAGALLFPRVPEFGSGTDASTVTSGSDDERIRNENFYAVTTFDIHDRYILDGLVRRDGSSLFGTQNRWATYYRVSGAWRVTQDLHVPGVDEWKLHASYGTAGLRPAFADQYDIFSVTGKTFQPINLGNPLLKPARSAELELGTNLDFTGDRFSLEYTYAQKKTTDQIILVPLLAVTGFQNQWQNVGALRARTHELTFAARMINTPGTQLTLNIVGDRTRQVITSWPIPEQLYGFEQMPAAFFLGNGSDLGVMYGNHWVRSVNELYDDPAKKALSGPGQTWSPDSVMVNEDGYVVRKSAYGTPNERAIKYVFCKVPGAGGACALTSNITKIGNANPDFNMSFGVTFNMKRIAVNALLDWSHGGQLYNGTRQWAFQATRDRVQDQFGKPTNDPACGAGPGGTTVPTNPMPKCPQKALPYYGVGFYNGLDPNDFFIEDGSYAKLKELSINYSFSPSTLRAIGLSSLAELRVGIVGRNLLTFTKYSGLDPEVSGLFGDPFQVRMDWFQYPQFRTLSAVVEVTY